MIRWRSWLATAAAILVLGLTPVFAGRTSADVSWLLYAARRVLEGERLYVDVVETNPPLIVWLNLAPAWMARALGIGAAPVYYTVVFALIVGSVLVSRALLARLLPGSRDLRRFLLLALLFVLVPLVGTNYGQREHLALALILPLALLAALRIGGVAVPGAWAAAVGAAAAVGIALKPYFLLPWLGLELAVRLCGRSRGLRPLPETIAIVLTGLVYLLLVPLLAPEYLSLAPLMAGTYFDYLRNSLAVTALVGQGAAPTLASLLIAALVRRHAWHRALWIAIASLTGGFYLAGVAQHKGWEYHFYPAFASGILLLGIVAMDVASPLGSLPRRLAVVAARAAAVTIPVLTLAGCLGRVLHPRDPRFEQSPDLPRLLPLVRDRAGDGPVLVLSWNAASAFPLIEEAGARAGMRFNFLWMLGGLYGAATASPEPLRYRPPEHMDPMERYLNDAVAEDLAERRPALLIVLAPAPDHPEWGLRRIDLLAYFQRDPGFAAEFARYRYRETIGQYWVFERLPEGGPPAPPRNRGSRWDPAAVAAVRTAENARWVDTGTALGILVFAVAFGVSWRRMAKVERTRTSTQPEVA